MLGRRRSLVAALILGTAFAGPVAYAAKEPADPCSLLPASEVSKIVGRAFDAPAKSVAPRPFPKTAQGTDCIYHAKGGRGSLQFRVYFDPSPAESTDLFKRLQGFYGSGTPAPGVGDEAYFDKQHALHARKGNVRYYLSLDGTGTAAQAREKLLASLGAGIGGRIWSL